MACSIALKAWRKWDELFEGDNKCVKSKTYSDVVLVGKSSRGGKEDIPRHLTSVVSFIKLIVQWHLSGHLSPSPSEASTKIAHNTANMLHRSWGQELVENCSIYRLQINIKYDRVSIRR